MNPTLPQQSRLSSILVWSQFHVFGCSPVVRSPICCADVTPICGDLVLGGCGSRKNRKTLHYSWFTVVWLVFVCAKEVYLLVSLLVSCLCLGLYILGSVLLIYLCFSLIFLFAMDEQRALKASIYIRKTRQKGKEEAAITVRSLI